MSERDADWSPQENDHVLKLGLALLGSVSANMRAVTLKISATGIHLHFVLECDDASDREEIEEEIIPEFAALFDRSIEIKAFVTVSSAPLFYNELPGRWIYRRKEA